jgi:hypothetical protein
MSCFYEPCMASGRKNALAEFIDIALDGKAPYRT